VLIVYRVADGTVVNISGLRPAAEVPRELVDSIRLVDRLPEGQAEYRIYDAAMMNAVWEAFDRGAKLEIALDINGQPVGIKADGAVLQGSTP